MILIESEKVKAYFIPRKKQNMTLNLTGTSKLLSICGLGTCNLDVIYHLELSK